MSEYQQFCPIAKASEVVAERWTPLVIREMLCGSTRFNEIRRGVPAMSPTLLSRRLRSLEEAGIIASKAGGGPGREYVLTAAGEELRPLIMGLGEWGRRWSVGRSSPSDLDPNLLMWDMRRRLVADDLDGERATVLFHFTDGAKDKRYYWMVVTRDGLDLCLSDPGYGVDMTLRTRVRTMVEVWMGDTRFGDAVRSGAMELEGPRWLQRALPRWMQLSVFAEVRRKVAAGG